MAECGIRIREAGVCMAEGEIRIPEGEICMAEGDIGLRESGIWIPLSLRDIPLIKISSTECPFHSSGSVRRSGTSTASWSWRRPLPVIPVRMAMTTADRPPVRRWKWDGGRFQVKAS